MMFVPPGGGNGVHGGGPAAAPALPPGSPPPLPPGSPPQPARTAHVAPPHVEHPVAEGLAHILGRQWPVVVTAVVVALLLGIAYLLVAPKTYTASATLRWPRWTPRP